MKLQFIRSLKFYYSAIVISRLRAYSALIYRVICVIILGHAAKAVFHMSL